MSRFLHVAPLAAVLVAAAAGFGFLAQAAPTGAAEPNADAMLAAGLAATDLQAEHLPPGDSVAGPKLGDEDHYMRRPAGQPTAPGSSSPQRPALTLRVVDGRYVFRIIAGGEVSTMSPETMARLAHIVMDRLAALDAGQLAAPVLPADAAVLPDVDSEFNPIMVSATEAADAQAWEWPAGATNGVLSPRLRDLLQRGVGNARVITRDYELAAHHGQVVEVTLIPFKTPEAAEAFDTVNKQLTPLSPGAKTKDGLTINVPTAGQQRYEADFRRGRYALELTCSARLGGTASGDCEGAVRDMAHKLTARIAALPGSVP